MLWVCCGLGVATALAVSWVCLDAPIARLFGSNLDRFAPLGTGLGSAVLVSGELLVMAILVWIRLASGHLWDSGKALLVAIIASQVTFLGNELALKVFFGVPNPTTFLLGGADHEFNLLHGSPQSSFPSGHMALASSFAFAFARLYWKALMPLGILLIFAGTMLIVGDWHFLSDVIAGTFVGASAGLAAGELWIQHNRRRPSD